MLSVQTAGCAGMERLGVPTRTTLNTPPDDRGQFICRMHIDAARDLLGVRNSEPVICGSNSNNHHHQLQQQQQHHQQQPQQQHNKHQHHNNSEQTTHLQQHHKEQQQQQHHHHQLLVRHRTSGPTINPTASHPTSASGNNSSISNNNLNNNTSGSSSNNCNNNLTPMTNNTDGNSRGLSKAAIPIVSASNSNNTTAVNATSHCGKLNKMCCVGGNSSDGGSGGGSTLSSCCSTIGSQCSLSSHSHDHHQHYQHQLQQQKTLCCPHHVPLPDSEWIPTDQRSGQMRSSYQHSELTRSYIKPPPNKTVKDVPDRSSYNFYSSVAHSSNSGLHSLTSSQSLPLSSSTASVASSTSSGSSSGSSGGGGVAPQTKSKPNVITKFFYRKSSPKSPNNVANSNSSTASLASSTASLSGFPANTMYSILNSTSSSSSLAFSLGSSNSSLLSSASGSTSSTMSLNSQASATVPAASALSMAPLATLPVSTAATLKTTPCDYGPNMQQNSGTGVNNISIGLVPSTKLLTTIGVSHPTATITTFPQTNAMERIPTPPLSVTVPISNVYHQQQQRQQQQLLLDCLVGDSASVSSTLQSIKSSSCSPTISAANAFSSNSDNSKNDDSVQMECQSGNITRNNSSSSMQSLSSAVTATPVECSCQHPSCKYCSSHSTACTDATTPSSSSSPSA